MIKEIQCNDNGRLFEIESEKLKLTVTNFGASIYKLLSKNSDGIWEDVVVTLDDYDEFIKNKVATMTMIPEYLSF